MLLRAGIPSELLTSRATRLALGTFVLKNYFKKSQRFVAIKNTCIGIYRGDYEDIRHKWVWGGGGPAGGAGGADRVGIDNRVAGGKGSCWQSPVPSSFLRGRDPKRWSWADTPSPACKPPSWLRDQWQEGPQNLFLLRVKRQENDHGQLHTKKWAPGRLQQHPFREEESTP